MMYDKVLEYPEAHEELALGHDADRVARFIKTSARELMCGVKDGVCRRILDSRVYFALVAPRAGQHHVLFSLLQDVIVGPLVRSKGISEFKVLAATPPSFVADDSTFIVFELIVPSARSITYVDVNKWREHLEPDVRLVVANPPPSRSGDVWNWERARAVLARAVALGVGDEPSNATESQKKQVRKATAFISACLQRDDEEVPETPRTRFLAQTASAALEPPSLFMTNAQTGKLHAVPSGATLMDLDIASELIWHLPTTVQWRTAWRLAYSPRVHGVSLQTFFRMLDNQGPSLLLLQDHNGHVFGAFASTSWHCSDRYYGSGESFVFKYQKSFPKHTFSHGNLDDLTPRSAPESPRIAATKPAWRPDAEPSDVVIDQALTVLAQWKKEHDAEAQRAAVMAAKRKDAVTSPTEAVDEILGGSFSEGLKAEPLTIVGLDDENDKGLQIFSWASQGDPYFLFSDAECLAVGGGSAFALYVEKDLLHGMSEASSTFRSSILSSETNFIVNTLECWVFDDVSDKSR